MTSQGAQIATAAVGGAVNGLFGLIGQKRQMKWQTEENEKAFERNKELAQFENQLNIDQWNRANQYNNPTSVINRLKDAGLSPALAYDKGQGMQPAQMSPHLSGGTPYQPVDMTMGGQRKTFGDVIQSAFNSALQAKQMQLIQADINKKDAETKGQNIENQYLPQMKENELAESLTRMGLNKAEEKRTLGLIENDKLAGAQIKQNIELVKTQIVNIDVNSYSQLVNLTFKQQELEISKYIAESNKELNDSNIRINNQQLIKMVQLLPYEVEQANLDNQKTYSDIMVNLATHAGILSDNEVKAYQAVQAGMKKEYILKHTGYTNYMMVMEAAEKTTKVLESLSRTLKNVSSLFKKEDKNQSDNNVDVESAIALSKYVK